ncbi:RNA-directed DNA polymerase, eukaryota, reverse transcriptase zinc-binding domain protein [Tanacetum coccineum]
MGSQRTKEDDVQRISTLVFVTNFSEYACAKDLWNACKQYGYVVDAFISNRRSKAGKKFGFVHFIKVFDVERLVNNLCTVWIGRHRIHANVAKFHRPTGLNRSKLSNQNGEYRDTSNGVKHDSGNRDNTKSYAYAVKGRAQENGERDTNPRGDTALKQRFHRLYALELNKKIDVASKLSQESLIKNFRRCPRSGVEQTQMMDLMAYIEGVVLGVASNRWYWSLDGSGEFTVASVRKVIDDIRLPVVATQTRWIKAVPIKVNVHAWKVSLDYLPTRLNLSRRGIDISSILCPICNRVTESSRHLFFECHFAKDIFRKICHWWNVDFLDVNSFDEWTSWIDNLRMPSKHNRLLQGACFGSWWYIWSFRNKCVFGADSPSKATIFDDLLASFS